MKNKNCKLRILPCEQVGGGKEKTSRRPRPPKNFRGSLFLRNTPELDIALRLGRIKGYDHARRILGSDGTYISGSDISMLIEEAMTPKRVLVGMDDFIKLLAKANVDPDSILNDNIKKKLVNYKKSINKRSQPIVRLERLNLDDYQHLMGKGLEKHAKETGATKKK